MLYDHSVTHISLHVQDGVASNICAPSASGRRACGVKLVWGNAADSLLDRWAAVVPWGRVKWVAACAAYLGTLRRGTDALAAIIWGMCSLFNDQTVTVEASPWLPRGSSPAFVHFTPTSAALLAQPHFTIYERHQANDVAGTL